MEYSTVNLKMGRRRVTKFIPLIFCLFFSCKTDERLGRFWEVNTKGEGIAGVMFPMLTEALQTALRDVLWDPIESDTGFI